MGGDLGFGIWDLVVCVSSTCRNRRIPDPFRSQNGKGQKVLSSLPLIIYPLLILEVVDRVGSAAVYHN